MRIEVGKGLEDIAFAGSQMKVKKGLQEYYS